MLYIKIYTYFISKYIEKTSIIKKNSIEDKFKWNEN